MWHVRAADNKSIIVEALKLLKERGNDFAINIRTESRKVICSSDDEFTISEEAIFVGHYDEHGKIWSTIINLNKVESIDFMER